MTWNHSGVSFKPKSMNFCKTKHLKSKLGVLHSHLNYVTKLLNNFTLQNSLFLTFD